MLYLQDAWTLLRRGRVVLLGLLLSAPAVALASVQPATQRTDSSLVVAAVARFHSALKSGDSASALAMLTSDAIVLESGGVESRSEYRSHHLPADISFARAVESSRTVVRVTVKGDAAWVSSTSTAKGDFSGRTIDSIGAELIVLTRAAGGWKISAIHWSSRNRKRPS